MADADRKADYGLDAPGVVRNLALAGLGLWAVSVVFHLLFVRHAGPPLLFRSFRNSALLMGAVFALEAGLMVFTSRVGKLRARDLLLAKQAWRGDEQVLDVGCGRGLLLLGAARRVPRGRAVGLDLWNVEDLSGNGREATEANVLAEGMAARVELVDGDAAAMPFPDASFDLVVSSLCLHNLYDPAKRSQALAEIHRVLKPGGRFLIQDFRHARAYAQELDELGAVGVTRSLVNPLLMFPPTWRVEGAKAVSDQLSAVSD